LVALAGHEVVTAGQTEATGADAVASGITAPAAAATRTWARVSSTNGLDDSGSSDQAGAQNPTRTTPDNNATKVARRAVPIRLLLTKGNRESRAIADLAGRRHSVSLLKTRTTAEPLAGPPSRRSRIPLRRAIPPPPATACQ
jgi:hypothetical protein